MSIIRNIIEKDDPNYIDISEAVPFKSANLSGCITLIFTKNSTRTKLDKNLFDDIGKPESVDILFTDKEVILVKGTGCKVSDDRIIYRTDIAKRIAEIVGVEIQKSGSTKAGTYQLQRYANDTEAAVVSFK